MRSAVAAVPVALCALCVPLATAGAHAASAAGKCTTQTAIWSHGNKHPLTMTKGKPTSSKISGGVDVTDGQVDAQWTLVTDGGTPAHFLNVTANQTTATLVSATVYPTKGTKKTFTVGKKSDFNYKYDLLFNVGQIMGPTSGDTGQGRPTPKLAEVVVKAKECPAAQ